MADFAEQRLAGQRPQVAVPAKFAAAEAVALLIGLKVLP
jgi:hypothetical protein